MKYLEITQAREAYRDGRNVTEFLRKSTASQSNNADIIEAAYDLQAGSYVSHLKNNYDTMQPICEEIARRLSDHVDSGESLLDVGTGEMTNLSLVLGSEAIDTGPVFAFDISWSRLRHGLGFWEETMGNEPPPSVFCADMSAIPLPTGSIDVVTSTHALEPNGANLKPLLQELFRVCRKRLILFEPSYELNSDEGKARMDRHGYIKNVPGVAEELGAEVVQVELLDNIVTPQNPTACFVIEPPTIPQQKKAKPVPTFTAPGSDFILRDAGSYYFAENVGLAFPVLEGIPVLKPGNAILATGLGQS